MENKGKASALQKWLQRKGKQATPTNTQWASIQTRPSQDRAPLSYAQKRLWLLQQLHPDNPFYHYTDIYELQGPLQLDVLRQAIKAIVTRHDVLRTRFVETTEDGLLQSIDADGSYDYKEKDLSNVPESEQVVACEEVYQKWGRAPYDLINGPLLRIGVVKCAEKLHHLVVGMHHIVTDKWSMDVFRKELATAYETLLSGKAPPWPPLRIQYGDFAYWQTNKPRPEAPLAYWKQKLAGPLPVLDLPLDRPRPNQPSYRGRYHERVLSLEHSQGLRDLAKANNTTLFVLLLSVYKVLLHRYAQQQDIVVGTPISIRQQAALEPLIGFFNETLALRTHWDKPTSFRQLIQLVHTTVMEAFGHQDTPFELVVEAVNPDRHANINPIFQAMFILHVVPPPPSFSSGLALTQRPLDMNTCKFDLTLYISDTGAELHTLFEYATDLFNNATIERMQDHLHTLIASVLDNSDCLISELNMLTLPEQDQLAKWQQAPQVLPTEWDSNDSYLKAFAKIVAEQPNATAVSFGDRQLSYQELAEQAGQVAQHIVSNTSTADKLIGLYTQRSVEMIIGIVAAHIAGKGYVPLDPAYPTSRLEYMLADAQVETILSTHQTSEDGAKLLQNRQLILIDDPATETSITLADRLTTGADYAYMIYTSGSSGQPKGVPVQQQQLWSSTAARLAYYTHQPKAFLLLSSYAFDSSVAGIFWTLSTGGHLVLPPERIEQDIAGLSQLVQEKAVTHTLLLPTLYETILQYASTEQLASFNSIIVAGEQCESSLVRRHYASLPKAQLYNEYGPTEATVWSTVAALSSERPTPVTIGRPIPGTQIRILDPMGASVPPGHAGELYIQSPGVTGQYWQRPSLSIERFIKLVDTKGHIQTYYRTGDMVELTNTGELLFLGRIDSQVKFRGFRIELEEIRAKLLEWLTISDAVVVISKKPRRLIAYYIAEGTINETRLREELQTKLPTYMVPTHLMAIDNIPRLPNGKVDAKSLPDPSASSSSEQPKDEMASGLAKNLLDIWRQVLKTDNVGLHDNFFSVGGDSILSIQVVAKARQQGIVLSPTAIFDHQTVAELALFAESEQPDQYTIPVEQLNEGPLLPIQHWFFDQHRNASHYWNQGIRWELPTDTTPIQIAQMLRQLVKQHAALRMTFQVADQRQFVSEIFPEIQVIAAPNDAIIEDILHTTQDKLALANVPAWHGLYFQRPNGGDHFYLLAHHLVIDAVSWSLLIEQLNSGISGELDDTYLRWAQQLQTWSEEGTFDQEVSYWSRQKALAVPFDLASTLPVEEQSVQVATLQLDIATSQALRQDAHQAYGTNTQDLLLVAFAKVLQERLSIDALSLSLEHHGRENILDSTLDLNSTIGWFTTAYPLLLRSDGAENIGEHVKRVKEQLRAVPNKGIGYGVLRYLTKEALLDFYPSIVFNYLGVQNSITSTILGKGTFLTGGVRHPKSERHHAWELNISMVNEQLEIHWSYSDQLHDSTRMTALLNQYGEVLKEVVQHCLQQDERSYTSSDFAEAELDNDDLDNLLAQL